MDPDAATLLIRITKMDPDPHKKIKAKKWTETVSPFLFTFIVCHKYCIDFLADVFYEKLLFVE